MIWGMIARVCVSGKGQMWNGRSRREERGGEHRICKCVVQLRITLDKIQIFYYAN